ncbi:carbohydrate ABC transporter substrate-binding protein (CUT1 family) [Herbihabitans rhizosphaerae]|uniref:Carbohydrate ABC transporter substrate-binding protein (CUT1 family) n=1 Tax=Herbihabitans rhizosphaerae TaxID=1872711 RepID=A0A4Q7L344_9PSEU|nr:extracellular solute-binding protein [Herbihabitans rhizosphaerae]RZS43556.1 carbohydrate ABC transporter substrate-binding protein (CUT1 family) [Herbihabitans rhizosphaerae]
MRRPLLLMALAVTLAAGCAPPQASNNQQQSGGGETTGELKVWLFQEANNTPKETVVAEAKREFEASHAGVTVNVEYLPVDGRANRFNGAFNDRNSSPDVAEFGNTDLAGYIASNGFADVSGDLAGWAEGKDLAPTVLDTAKINGKTYGIPWFTGTRALYYRTDVFTELRINPPKTLTELADTARAIRKAKPDLYGIATGGKYVYAALPYVWAHGGDVATRDGDKWTAGVTSAASREGLRRYAELINDDICPPAACAQLTGSQSVAAFAAGKAGMVIGGDFNRKAIEAGTAKGKYAVIPLPGKEIGAIAPPFAGGNLLGVFRASKKYSLSMEFSKLLAGKKYQRKMYQAMGNLPTFTDVQSELAGADPTLAAFVASVKAGAKFVPASPAWTKIDAANIIPTAIQQIATRAQSVEAATDAAAAEMNKAFGG